MNGNLSSLVLKKEYRSLEDNVVQEFYLPTLYRANSYKRAVGFFSSSALIEISKGICQLVKNGGKIHLVASPYLSKEDVEAIRKGYESRQQIIENALLRELDDEHLDYYSSERLNFLANLIAHGVLDIKIAITEKKCAVGMYHEKMGIIEDDDHNCIAFSGSMNESSTAISVNYETIDVFCSWNGIDEKNRVDLKKRAFYKIWNNTDDNVEVMTFPKVNDAIIERYRKNKEINYNIDKAQFSFDYVHSKSHKTSCGARKPESIELYEYQKEAIANWVSENYRGIFDMATGTGKTLTGLGAVSKLSEDVCDELSVFILCPYQHLVEQWVEDIVKFNIKPIIGYSASPQKDWKKRLQKAIKDQRIRKDKPFFCFVTTNATFSGRFVQDIIKGIKHPILLVVDEAHNVGAKTYAKLLDDRFQYRLALSATLDRHRDEEGTAALYNFFGRKCIEYF